MVAPVVEKAISFATNRVSVFFNEPMLGLSTPANFTIAGLIVTAASPNSTRTRVDLTTGGQATGTITTVGQASLVDGETFTINDGYNPAAIFEFNTPGGAVTAGNYAVNMISGATATQMRDAVIEAINFINSALSITASVGGVAIVNLTNDRTGAAGNISITETVANVSFVVSGMSGGSIGMAQGTTYTVVCGAGVTDDGSEALGVNSAIFDGGESFGPTIEVDDEVDSLRFFASRDTVHGFDSQTNQVDDVLTTARSFASREVLRDFVGTTIDVLGPQLPDPPPPLLVVGVFAMGLESIMVVFDKDIINSASGTIPAGWTITVLDASIPVTVTAVSTGTSYVILETTPHTPEGSYELTIPADIVGEDGEELGDTTEPYTAAESVAAENSFTFVM